MNGKTFGAFMEYIYSHSGQLATDFNNKVLAPRWMMIKKNNIVLHSELVHCASIHVLKVFENAVVLDRDHV